MTTDTTERGLEELIVRGMTGRTDVLVPSHVPEEHVHLMAQVMETWFVADPENVKGYYGKDFNEGALPKHAQPESVPKPAIESGLEKATQNTKKGRYHKIRHGSDLLALIAPDTVKPKCPHCKRLFDGIEALLA